MNNLKQSDLVKVINDYAVTKKITHRYASFDICFTYFQSHKTSLKVDMEKSCLYLWSYLASWGMLRGSSDLLKKCSPAALKPLIEYFDSLKDNKIWDIDVPDYKLDENVKLIIGVYKAIAEKLVKVGIPHPSVTLITKIMLGVFGCVPAFDRNFKSAFSELIRNKLNGIKSGFNTISKHNLDIIYKFYRDNKIELDQINMKIKVMDFDGIDTARSYTYAKLIDMYGFTKGIYITK